MNKKLEHFPAELCRQSLASMAWQIIEAQHLPLAGGLNDAIISRLD